MAPRKKEIKKKSNPAAENAYIAGAGSKSEYYRYS